VTRRSTIARRAARYIGITRDTASEPGICRVCEATEHLHDACSNVRIEILQELFLLVDQIVDDARAEPLSLPCGAQRCRATVFSIRTLLNVSLPNQGADDAAGRALVQEQAIRQRAEAQWTVLNDRLERVTLRDRDVVAADAVAVPKLIDADKIGDCLVQGEGVPVKRRLLGIHSWYRAGHLLLLTTIVPFFGACQASFTPTFDATSELWRNPRKRICHPRQKPKYI
jgi:hypothetical protein